MSFSLRKFFTRNAAKPPAIPLQEDGPTPQEIETLVSLFTEGRYTEAATIARTMTVRFPLHGLGWKALGVVFKRMGRNADALAPMQKAAALSPHDAEAHSNLIFTLDLLEDNGIGELQAERRRWHEQHGRRFAGAIKPHDNLPDPERRLRIGFISADFRRHSAYYIFSPIILRHDRNAFEVVCYSGVKVEDDATARLRHAAHEWRSTLGVSDEALAEQIRRDRIDILVDLSGHTAGNRLLVFARRSPGTVGRIGAGRRAALHPRGRGCFSLDLAALVRPVERLRRGKQFVTQPALRRHFWLL